MDIFGLEEGNLFIIATITIGKYYWAVQSMDASGRLSVESPEEIFYINAPIDLGADHHVCQGENLHLSVPQGNYSAEWYSQSRGLIADSTNSVDLPIQKDEKIWVKLHKNYGGVVSDTMVVFCHAYPNLDLPQQLHPCPGETITLQTQAQATSYQWLRFDGQIIGQTREHTQTAMADDSLILQATSDYHCTSFDTTYIYLKELPSIDIEDTYSACQNEEISIRLDRFPEIEWRDPQTGVLARDTNLITLPVTAPRNLEVRVKNTQGCWSEKAFSLQPPPFLRPMPEQIPCCAKGSPYPWDRQR